jgi:hypothetical protein
MGQRSSRRHQPPKVNAKEVLKRKRLETELFSLDGQVRGFDRIRERLAATGKDPSVFYRQLQARREKIVATLKQPTKPSGAVHPFAHLEQELLALPIAAAKFNHLTGIFGFGTIGLVQLAPASEGIQDVVAPHNAFPHSGNIITVPGSIPGAVMFNGHLQVGPEQIPADQYDPTINYFWIHNWNYLIPFPPPTVESLFSYRFTTYAGFSIMFAGGEGNISSFVTLGVTPNLMTATEVKVGPESVWPLPTTDLTQPAPGYNGHYGEVSGRATVQGSFMVGAGGVPGIAVVVGTIVALSMMSEVSLYFPSLGNSGIEIYSASGGAGRVEYCYEPQPIVSSG